jgi:hypothetical protein
MFTPPVPEPPGRQRRRDTADELETSVRQRLLQAASGLDRDERVARHITAIIARLGVQSRFAADAAAQRRGWIG